MKPAFLARYSAVLGMLICAGCSTPKAMLDLADKTSGNVALLNNRINAYAENQQDLIKQRAYISAEVAEQFAELSARNQVRMEAMRLAGMNNELSLILGIINSSDVAATNQAQLLQVAANQTKLISDAQLQLKTYNSQLKTVSDSLAELAKDDDLKTRLANLVAYAQAVKASMDAAQTNANATNAGTALKSLHDKTANEIKNIQVN